MTEPAFTQHVGELVRKFFWRQKGTGGVAAQAVGAPAVASASEWSGGETVVASRLQLIGLAKVRSSLGDRWPKLAERVRGIAQGIIDKHLLPGDVCEPHGDEGFLVLFPQLSPSDAKFKSDAICREIEKRLIKENLSDVSACSADISVVGAAEAFLDPKARTSDSADDGEGNSIAAKLKRMRRKSDWQPRDNASKPSDKPSSKLSAKSAGEQGAAVPAEGEEAATSSGDTSAQRTGDKSEPAVVLKEITPARRYTDMEWAYQPVWDFKSSALVMFALHPKQDRATESAGSEVVLDCDTAGVSKCISDLAALSASGRRLPLLTPIHYATIDNARGRAFFQGTVRSVPAEFRKLISFEIIGCPQGGLNFGICSFVSALRIGGVRVALRVDTQWPDFLAAERAGAQIVTMDAFEQQMTESERMIAFEIFAARAANAKLEGGMWGLATRSLVVAAASAGIRYLSGGAVSPEITSLSHAVRFSPIDLYPHS